MSGILTKLIFVDSTSFTPTSIQLETHSNALYAVGAQQIPDY